MKNDIKKKFIDILFEPEEDEAKPEKKTEPVSPASIKKQENTIKAKDILYRKSEKSAFINLDEGKKTEEKKKTENVYGDYEFSSQISPIFGVIKENKPEFNASVSVNETYISKPDSSHLEIITSPIYGYGSRQDDSDQETNLFEQVPEVDEELHMLLDDDYGYDEHMYDDYEKQEEISLFDSYGDEK